MQRKGDGDGEKQNEDNEDLAHGCRQTYWFTLKWWIAFSSPSPSLPPSLSPSLSFPISNTYLFLLKTTSFFHSNQNYSIMIQEQEFLKNTKKN